MSRHRNIRALDYDEEYDDYYQDDYDEYDDFVSAPKQLNKPLPASQKKTAPNAKYQPQSQQQSSKTTTKSSSKQPSFAAGNQSLSKQSTKGANTKHANNQQTTQKQIKEQQTVVAAAAAAKQKKTVAAETLKEYEAFVKSSKPRVNLIVVGHVDAGKSTLVGRFLCDAGSLSQKQMHKNTTESQRQGKASFKYAWALDETDEERQRGVTIDLAFTKFETKNRIIVVLDSPGHVDFIPAVISGAAQADAAILVVDATNGEFETGFEQGGQTKEHAFLVRSLGVKSLIVVVNKMDNVSWSWVRYQEVKTRLTPFLKQVGFDIESEVQFIAASGLTGENLTQRRQHAQAVSNSSHPQLESQCLQHWHHEMCLNEALDKLPTPARLVDKPTRVVINNVYKGLIGGVHLSGKVSGGKVFDGQSLVVMPPNETCVVKSVEIRDLSGGNQIPTGKAFAGDIVTLVASGVDMQNFYRSCILCEPSAVCSLTNRFECRIIMFQGVECFLIEGSCVEVHMNEMYESGEVRRLKSLINKSTGQQIRRRPKCVPQNSSAIVQLRLTRPVCVELYSDNKDLGRFMLRSCGRTVAAGLVTRLKSAKVVSSVKLKTK